MMFANIREAFIHGNAFVWWDLLFFYEEENPLFFTTSWTTRRYFFVFSRWKNGRPGAEWDPVRVPEPSRVWAPELCRLPPPQPELCGHRLQRLADIRGSSVWHRVADPEIQRWWTVSLQKGRFPSSVALLYYTLTLLTKYCTIPTVYKVFK